MCFGAPAAHTHVSVVISRQGIQSLSTFPPCKWCCHYIFAFYVHVQCILQLSHHLCMILLYDLLLGKGIQCGGPIKRFLFQHKMELLVAFRKITEKISISDESTGTIIAYSTCLCVLRFCCFTPVPFFGSGRLVTCMCMSQY